MNQNQKIVLFEYFLKKLVDWFCNYYYINVEDFNDHPQNDLSKLKAIKLHFFACSTNEDALQIFDDFRAMPYGHVESDVYNSLDLLQYICLTNSKLEILNWDALTVIENDNIPIIDDAVENLKERNFDLISFSPFALVELSHKWFSWQYNFSQAKNIGIYSKPISTELISREPKLYSLH